MAGQGEAHPPPRGRTEPPPACLRRLWQGVDPDSRLSLGTRPAHRTESAGPPVAALRENHAARPREYPHARGQWRRVPTQQRRAGRDSRGRRGLLRSVGRQRDGLAPWRISDEPQRAHEVGLHASETRHRHAGKPHEHALSAHGHRNLAPVGQGGSTPGGQGPVHSHRRRHLSSAQSLRPVLAIRLRPRSSPHRARRRPVGPLRGYPAAARWRVLPFRNGTRTHHVFLGHSESGEGPALHPQAGHQTTACGLHAKLLRPSSSRQGQHAYLD